MVSEKLAVLLPIRQEIVRYISKDIERKFDRSKSQKNR